MAPLQFSVSIPEEHIGVHRIDSVIPLPPYNRGLCISMSQLFKFPGGELAGWLVALA